MGHGSCWDGLGSRGTKQSGGTFEGQGGRLIKRNVTIGIDRIGRSIGRHLVNTRNGGVWDEEWTISKVEVGGHKPKCVEGQVMVKQKQHERRRIAVPSSKSFCTCESLAPEAELAAASKLHLIHVTRGHIEMAESELMGLAISGPHSLHMVVFFRGLIG